MRRAVGWSTIGLGAASLAASAVTFAVRQRALSDLRAGCADYATAPCPPGLRSTVDRGQLASTLTTGFLVAGGALAASGAALVVFSPSSRGGAGNHGGACTNCSSQCNPGPSCLMNQTCGCTTMGGCPLSLCGVDAVCGPTGMCE